MQGVSGSTHVGSIGVRPETLAAVPRQAGCSGYNLTTAVRNSVVNIVVSLWTSWKELGGVACKPGKPSYFVD